jgi:hypothetical protein
VKKFAILSVLLLAGCEAELPETGAFTRRVGATPGGRSVYLIEVEGQKYLVVSDYRAVAICPHTPNGDAE